MLGAMLPTNACKVISKNESTKNEMNCPRKSRTIPPQNHFAKLVLGVPSGSAKHQLGLWMGCSLLDIT